jgi:PIN domain nuclease of toxin-antitoxin system
VSEIVLDASALLALLKDEPGGRKVAEGIATSRMSAVNYAEVVSHFIHAGMPPLAVDAMLRPLPVNIVAADTDLASTAGRLRSVTAEAGLSLGDRFCLALALRDGLPAWTADRQWRTVSDALGAEIVVIR